MKTQSSVTQPVDHSGSPLIQVSGALVAIIVFIVLAAWLAKRFGFATRAGNDRSLNISASVNVGPKERVVVVDVEEVRLVLGVTPTHITHLHTLPPTPLDESEVPPAAAADFQSLMKNLLKHNGKN